MQFYLNALEQICVRHPAALRIIQNMGWDFLDRILRFVSAIFITAWIARHLGTAQFGILSYGQSFVGIAGIFIQLAQEAIVVRELVRHPDKASTLLGSAFLLLSLGAISSFVLCVFAIMILRPDSPLVQMVVWILSLNILACITDVANMWFNSKLQRKYSVIGQNVVLATASIIRIGFIWFHAPLLAFAWLIPIEGFFYSLFLIVLFHKKGMTLRSLRIDWNEVGSLLRESWPLLISNFSIFIYMRIDQLMLGRMIGDEAVGLFAIVVRLTETWYVLPGIFMGSLLPVMIRRRVRDEEHAYKMLQSLFYFVVILAIAISAPMALSSHWIIVTLYGQNYAPAGSILALYIWASVFVFLNYVSTQWFASTQQQMFVLYRALCGVVINFVLNWALIPRFGIVGAAAATLCAQIITGFLIDAFHPATRRIFFMKARAFNPVFVISELRALLRSDLLRDFRRS